MVRKHHKPRGMWYFIRHIKILSVQWLGCRLHDAPHGVTELHEGLYFCPTSWWGAGYSASTGPSETQRLALHCGSKADHPPSANRRAHQVQPRVSKNGKYEMRYVVKTCMVICGMGQIWYVVKCVWSNGGCGQIWYAGCLGHCCPHWALWVVTPGGSPHLESGQQLMEPVERSRNDREPVLANTYQRPGHLGTCKSEPWANM